MFTGLRDDADEGGRPRAPRRRSCESGAIVPVIDRDRALRRDRRRRTGGSTAATRRAASWSRCRPRAADARGRRAADRGAVVRAIVAGSLRRARGARARRGRGADARPTTRCSSGSSAVAVSMGDVLVLRGEPRVVRLAFGLRRPKQPVIGRDVAGVVEAVGAAVTRVRASATPCSASPTRAAIAELVAVPERFVAARPDIGRRGARRRGRGVGHDRAAGPAARGRRARAARARERRVGRRRRLRRAAREGDGRRGDRRLPRSEGRPRAGDRRRPRHRLHARGLHRGRRTLRRGLRPRRRPSARPHAPSAPAARHARALVG